LEILLKNDIFIFI